MLILCLTFIEYSSNKQRLGSECAYVQADLRLCWLHIPHCWKSHVAVRLKRKATYTCRNIEMFYT